MADQLSFCRICAAACGIVVTIEGDQVVRVRGDAKHPVSHGYVCSKGRGIPAFHHGPGRLDRPRVRDVEASWNDTLDDLAAVVRSSIERFGADSVALYMATGLAYDSLGQIAAGTWLPAIGSSAFYTAATVDNAPLLVAAELVTGSPWLNPIWDPHESEVLVLVGMNPVVSHGYRTAMPDPISHHRDFRERGGRVWVLDPRRSESAALADEHLAVRPGSDVAVLAALVRELLRDGADEEELTRHCHPDQVARLRVAVEPFTAERAIAVAGIDHDGFDRLLADLRAHHGRIAMSCGTGTTMSNDGVLVEWLTWVLLILTGSIDRKGGMRFNVGSRGRVQRPDPSAPPSPPGPRSRPELPRVAGQLPVVALADEIEAGNVRVLFVTGGSPITALPEPERTRRALRMLDALVVIDVVEGELTDLATHVLPATSQLERADLLTVEGYSVRSGTQVTTALVEPVAERKPLWWMFAGLAKRLGVEFVGTADPDALTDELYLRQLLEHSPLGPDAVIEAGPRGVDIPVEYGWVHETVLPDGRWRIAPPVLIERLATHETPPPGLVLAPRREMAWMNSVRCAGRGDEAVVRLNPIDAEAAGVVDGLAVTVSTAHGAITASARIDANVKAGVVSITHARGGQNPSELTSPTEGVDRLTTMPHASGVPVSVRPA